MKKLKQLVLFPVDDNPAEIDLVLIGPTDEQRTRHLARVQAAKQQLGTR